ncbi:MAG: sigma-E factor regulatory protein RseB domain-containing protein [Syntrophothermus sp.]
MFKRAFVSGIGILAALLALSPPVAGYSEDFLVQLLEKANNSPALVDYIGNQVVVDGTGGDEHTTVVKIFHRRPGLTRYEYQESADRAGWVVIDDGADIWQFEPRGRLVISFRSISGARLRQQQAEELELLRRNYRFRHGGIGKVADREAHIVEITPKHPGSPSQRLWIDRENSLTLKTEKFRANGSLEYLSYFVDIDMAASPDEELFQVKIPPGVDVVRHPGVNIFEPVPVLRAKTGVNIRLPNRLPPGFVFAGASMAALAQFKGGVYLKFTDGLNVISLFETVAPRGRVYVVDNARRVSIGGIVGYLMENCDVQLLNWTANGTNYTLIGEVPPEVLLQMAESIGGR